MDEGIFGGVVDGRQTNRRFGHCPLPHFSWRTSKLILGTLEEYNSSVEPLSLLLTLVPLLLSLLSLLLSLSLALLSLNEETKISTNVNSKKPTNKEEIAPNARQRRLRTEVES